MLDIIVGVAIAMTGEFAQSEIPIELIRKRKSFFKRKQLGAHEIRSCNRDIMA